MTFSDSIDRYFHITERGSTISTEIKGGIITFLAMVYILPVNMNILGRPEVFGDNVPYAALYASTAIAAVLACILMGIYAKFPVALAPGMGINVFIVNTICISMGFTFSQALMTVFISGILFFIVSVTGFRKRLIDTIPMSIKAAITAGIGFLITVVGLYNSGIIVSGSPTPVLGNLGQPTVLLALFCIIVTMVLYFLNRWSAVIVGMVSTCIVGCVTGVISNQYIDMYGILTIPDFSLVGCFILDFGGFDAKLIPSFLIAILSLFVVDVFDTTGTLLGIGQISGLADEKGDMEGMDRAMNADAAGTIIGAAVGTSTTTSFIESCTGVEAGAKTGLMAVVVGLLFLVAMFFATPFTLVTSACTTGALILVGILMIESVRHIEWDDHVIATSAFLTIFMMGLSGSISDGIGFGIIAYCIGMIVTRKYRDISWFMYLLGAIFLVYFILVKAIIPSI